MKRWSRGHSGNRRYWFAYLCSLLCETGVCTISPIAHVGSQLRFHHVPIHRFCDSTVLLHESVYAGVIAALPSAQACHTFVIDLPALSCQCTLHLAHAIQALAFNMQRSHRQPQFILLHPARLLGILLPDVETTARHLHQTTCTIHRQVTTMGCDECVFHF